MVSSTKVRDAVKSKVEDALGKLVTDGVAKFILENRLYLDSELPGKAQH